EEHELQQVAHDQFDIAIAHAHEPEECDDPVAVEEQQDNSWNRQQARPGQRHDHQRETHKIKQGVVHEIDHDLERRASDIEVDADVRAHDVDAVAHEGLRAVDDERRYRGPNDDAEADI